MHLILWRAPSRWTLSSPEASTTWNLLALWLRIMRELALLKKWSQEKIRIKWTKRTLLTPPRLSWLTQMYFLQSQSTRAVLPRCSRGSVSIWKNLNITNLKTRQSTIITNRQLRFRHSLEGWILSIKTERNNLTHSISLCTRAISSWQRIPIRHKWPPLRLWMSTWRTNGNKK